jgi:hypothetical protein
MIADEVIVGSALVQESQTPKHEGACGGEDENA